MHINREHGEPCVVSGMMNASRRGFVDLCPFSLLLFPSQVLSEDWVIDSVAAGRLLKMADYAKHGERESPHSHCCHPHPQATSSASPGVDVDLPYLFVPSPFPPTYRVVVSHLQDMPEDLLFDPNQDTLRETETKQDGIHKAPLLQVLGPFQC